MSRSFEEAKNTKGNAMSLRWKITGMAAIFTTVTLGAVTYMNIGGNKENMENVTVENVTNSMKVLQYEVGQQFSSLKNQMAVEKNIIETIQRNNPVIQANDVKSSLKNMMLNERILLDAYIGDDRGNMFTGTDDALPEGYKVTATEWYKKALAAQGDVVITTPYSDAITGETIVTMAQMLSDKKTVLAIDVKLTEIMDMIEQLATDYSTAPSVMNEEGKVVVSDQYKTGEDVSNAVIFKVATNKDGQPHNVKRDGLDEIYIAEKETGWIITTNVSEDKLNELIKPLTQRALLVGGIGLLISLFLLQWAIQNALAPLKRVRGVVRKISEGDLTKRVDYTVDNEIGEIGEEINKMVEQLEVMVRAVNDTSSSLAAAADQLSTITEENASSIKQITDSMQEVANGSNQNLISTNQMSEILKQVSEKIEIMDNDIVEVASSTNNTSDRASEGVGVIQDAISQIDLVKIKSIETSEDLRKLVERVNEILKFNETVENIATQTNMLSLNAAIEAAHAGEHGKGFAIVAEEIRQLAEQSKQAAQEINMIVGEVSESAMKASESMKQSVSAVEMGNVQVLNAGASFEEISKEIRALESKMIGLKEGIEVLTKGAEGTLETFGVVSNVSEEITGSIDNVASVTEEQSASMDEISESAKSLEQIAADLKYEIEKFKL